MNNNSDWNRTFGPRLLFVVFLHVFDVVRSRDSLGSKRSVCCLGFKSFQSKPRKIYIFESQKWSVSIRGQLWNCFHDGSLKIANFINTFREFYFLFPRCSIQKERIIWVSEAWLGSSGWFVDKTLRENCVFFTTYISPFLQNQKITQISSTKKV